MTTSSPERHAVVDRLLAEPPVVHAMDRSSDPALGVWSTEPSCYHLLADHCPPGTRTLETGAGLSTVVFAALGADHICCTGAQVEADRIVAHCTEHGIAVDGLRFEIGASHRTLPPLEAAGVERDLVLVDGGHGFPLPILDWLYGAELLRVGGILVLDDIDLPAVRVLRAFLDQDPRWPLVGGTAKWRAWRRTHPGSLVEDWTDQLFYRTRRRKLEHKAHGAWTRLRRLVRPS